MQVVYRVAKKKLKDIGNAGGQNLAWRVIRRATHVAMKLDKLQIFFKCFCFGDCGVSKYCFGDPRQSAGASCAGPAEGAHVGPRRTGLSALRCFLSTSTQVSAPCALTARCCSRVCFVCV